MVYLAQATMSDLGMTETEEAYFAVFHLDIDSASKPTQVLNPFISKE
ncbi:hypothetical protein C211_18129 [Stutzerimonas degradans]|nr:hypothetical protein C211_21517 [Stutzerimonas degradans]EKM94470.1 hypothetical protein C211_18129 [Stutzerimonas degradans]